MDKKAVRQRLLGQRKQLTFAACEHLSQQVQQQLLEADSFSSCETLALYSPINNEVRTDRLLATARATGKRICFPRVCDSEMLFVVVGADTVLAAGSFGVAEPKTGEVLSASEIDLIVVPGIAFDRHGFRLGYGKGFYDRELSGRGTSTVTVGLCYDFQLCATLPVEAHDQRLDYIATQTQLIPCH